MNDTVFSVCSRSDFRPEQLWILNPTKILKRLDINPTLEVTEKTPRCAEAAPVKSVGNIDAEILVHYTDGIIIWSETVSIRFHTIH